MNKIIVLGRQAAERMREELTAKPGKFLKVAQKAFASRETSAALRNKIVSSNLYRTSNIYRSFQGMIYVFVDDGSCLKLETVVHPDELSTPQHAFA